MFKFPLTYLLGPTYFCIYRLLVLLNTQEKKTQLLKDQNHELETKINNLEQKLTNLNQTVDQIIQTESVDMATLIIGVLATAAGIYLISTTCLPAGLSTTFAVYHSAVEGYKTYISRIPARHFNNLNNEDSIQVKLLRNSTEVQQQISTQLSTLDDNTNVLVTTLPENTTDLAVQINDFLNWLLTL